MGSVNMVLEKLNIPQGPRGGRIDNPKYHPQNRNRPLDAPVVESDGERIIGLHDPRKMDTTRQGIEREQPWHRMAAHMLNRGFSNIEVADVAGVSKEMVSLLRAQRWFNELCVSLAESRESVIRERLNGYGLEAVEAIAQTAFSSDPDIPERVKLQARTTLLEQAVGKPTQKVLSVSATTSFSSEREEYDAIMQELAQISGLVGSGAEGHDGPKPVADAHPNPLPTSD